MGESAKKFADAPENREKRSKKIDKNMKKLRAIFVGLLYVFWIATTQVAVAETCTSSQIDTGTSCVDTKFTVTTTGLTNKTGKTFKFVLSAAGTFYVDWGDGSVANTIIRDNTTPEEYSHTYATDGEKTIKFAGLATEYNTVNYANDKDPSGAAIRFSASSNTVSSGKGGSPTLVKSFDGSVGSIFPTLGENENQIPIFFEFCLGCTNLTSISDNLFSGVTGAKKNMFRSIFDKCSNLKIIPANLFSGVNGSAESMFRSAFYDCSSLTNLPEGLFAGINGGAPYMFKYTFFGAGKKAPGLKSTYIPAHLFDGAHGQNPTEFMLQIFNSSGLLTSCPEGTEPVTTGYESQWNGKVACQLPTNLECEGATYKSGNICLECPTGYDYDTIDGKTSIDQCKMHCDAGTWTGQYTQLEYIEGTGTQYIDTKHVIRNTKLSVSFEISSGTNVSGNIGHFGGNQDVLNGHASNFKDSAFGVWVQNGTSGSKVKISGTFSANIVKKIQYDIDGNKRILTVDNEQNNDTFDGTIISSNTYRLFSNGCVGGCNDILLTGRMHRFKMSEGAQEGDDMVVVFDMIPVRRLSDNAVGMYDRISGKFFGNVGEDDFIAGPDVATIGGSVCEDVGHGFYSGATTTSYGSISERGECPEGKITYSVNATSASECVNAADNIVCPAGTYIPENSDACVACPAGSWCPGGILQVGTSIDQGISSCTNQIGSGWSSEAGASAQTDCYYLLTLDKNGYTGIINANSGIGCTVINTANGTDNAILKIFYNTECTLPAINLTQTGFSGATNWSASGDINNNSVTTILPLTATPNVTRYYAQKLCPANRYATQAGTCAVCGANSSTIDRNAASACTCNSGYTSNGSINGSTLSTNGCSEIVGGLYSCDAGYYLPAYTEICSKCLENNYCSGGTYQFSTIPQGITQCPNGLVAPQGMWEGGQCGRKLNIGNDKYVYLRSTKATTPALYFDTNNDGVADFFGNMTTQSVPMNVDFANLSENNKLKVNIPVDFVSSDGTTVQSNTYYIYDDTVTVNQ